MFSYLRNHRVGSSPSSPRSPKPSTFAKSPAAERLESPQFPLPTTSSSPRVESPISPLPPILPPIPRVASQSERDRATSESKRAKVVSRQQEQESHAVSNADVLSPRQTLTPTHRGNASQERSPVLSPIPRVSSFGEQGVDGSRRPAASSNDTERVRTQRHSWMPQSKVPPGSNDGFRKPVTAFRDREPSDGRAKQHELTNNSLSAPRRPRSPTSSTCIDPSLGSPLPFRSSSPASSFSSYVRPASSTNVAYESSPASSKSASAAATHNPPARSSKAKFNLLNPVHLLMRRRTSQPQESPHESPTISSRTMESPAMTVPDDYDPRIRGKGVHDFSAPRPKPSQSTTDVYGLGLQTLAGSNEPGTQQRRRSVAGVPDEPPDFERTIEKEHVPVFVENFDDDMDGDQGSSAVQRESLANTSFLARFSRQLDFDALDNSTPTARPKPISEEPRPQSSHAQKNSKTTDDSSFRVSSDVSTMRSSISNDTRATTPPRSPNSHPSRTSLALEPPIQSNDGLKHLPSSASHASRFSFQLNSDHSNAQEKALEDKHKQKAASKAADRASVRDSRFDEFDEEDLGNYDDIDDDDYEEDVPLNDGGLGLGMPSGINPLQSPFPTSPGVDSSMGMYSVMSNNQATVSGTQGFSLSPHMHDQEVAGAEQASDRPVRTQTRSTMTTDDMYFDDGVIEHPSTYDESLVDENMFDSPVEQKYDQGAIDEALIHQPTRLNVVAPPTKASSTYSKREEDDDETATLSAAEESKPSLDTSQSLGLEHNDQELSDVSATNEPNHLNAYHSALASAASKAAIDGRFQRQMSLTASSSVYGDLPSQRESFDDDNMPQKFVPNDDAEDDYELDEDTMIAEANAEVLASEDSDDYGRDFGFYANPATGDGSSSYGGYFGNPLEDNPANGRNAIREPNLTPITERSEFSARNSFISTSAFGPPSLGGQNQRGSSVGLKELAASAGLDDEDMTLGQLLRLRKEAFGERGRSNSFGSSDNSPSSLTGSSPWATRKDQTWSSSSQHQHSSSNDEIRPHFTPVEEDDTASVGSTGRYSWGFGSKGHSRRGSAETFMRDYSDMVEQNPHVNDLRSPNTNPAWTGVGNMAGQSRPLSPLPESGPSSPRHTLASPGAVFLPSSSPMPIPSAAMMQKFAMRPQVDSYRKSWAPQPPKRGSLSQEESTIGPGSVTYSSEETPEGETRWYKERRRRTSSGEMLVERQLVEGGKI
ncbi:MAG: hypothetical protein M1828_002451 [Chrysothrix sp. TS-e1954]|nr:MAG: hypothetical protein M1828_002451 [Chrysothrix sp. TS-e1954]